MDDANSELETQHSRPDDSSFAGSDVGEPKVEPALVLVWSRDEPERVGEVVLLPAGESRARVLGRGGALPDDVVAAPFVRQRPGINEITGPLGSERVSRVQLEIRTHGSELELTNVGRGGMKINGKAAAHARVREGDLIELERRLSLLCTRRPTTLEPFVMPAKLRPPSFGQPDGFGMVGESPAAWELRRALAFAAQRDAHLLLVGPSGSGKELAAASLHGLSSRADRPFVARNAATLPAGLIDAELFGHARNYPNVGMPARPGLIGEADDGTLFLDEIGELPHDAQAHLLRVMDAGEYRRLGDVGAQRSRARIIAATNRDPSDLKHDFLARFPLRLRVPGLDQRREDIPLLARHLLGSMARDEPGLIERFWRPAVDPVAGCPRFAPRLIAGLLCRAWVAHARELEGLLWQAVLTTSHGSYLQAPATIAGPEPSSAAHEPGTPHEVDPRSLTEAELRDALARAKGVKDQAWKALGLRNRFQLRRLLDKYGIE